MNNFDEHIKSRMNQMEVNPPPEIGNALKAHYPKPGFVHYLRRFYPAVVSVVVLTCLTAFFVQTSQNDSRYEYQSYNFDYNLEKPVIIESENSLVDPVDMSDCDSQKLPNEVLQTGNCRTIYSYDTELVLPMDEGYNVLQLDKELKTTMQDDCMKIKSISLGEYRIVVGNDKNADTICIRFLAKPEIFEERNIRVCGLDFTGELLISTGEWLGQSTCNPTVENSKFFVSRESYGKCELVRKANTKFGSFTDTLSIVFVPQVNINVEVDKAANCYGDDILISVKGNKARNTKVWLNAGMIEQLGESQYRIKPDYTVHAAFYCYFSYQDEDCSIFDSLRLNLPEKPLYELLTEPASCVQAGEIRLVTENNSLELNTTDDLNADPEELKAGFYEVIVSDESGCEYRHEIEIVNEGDVSAYFDYRMSLDGMSIQTINETRGVDEYLGELKYEWYLNGEFISDMREPVVDLNEISNDLRLRVSYGEACFDEYSINDIRPDHELIRCGNFFTPNGDGENDIFQLILDPRLVDFNVKVMNRAGHLVYEWSQPEDAWDGKISGGQYAAEAVYFYVIQAFDANGKPYEKKGTIQLIRD